MFKSDDGTRNHTELQGSTRAPLRYVSMSTQHWDRSTAQRVLNAVRSGIETSLHVPLWFSRSTLTQATLGNSATVYCDTTSREFIAGGKAAIIASDSSWEVATIQTVNSDSLVMTGNVSGTFAIGSDVVPVILAIPEGAFSSTLQSERVAADSISFREFTAGPSLPSRSAGTTYQSKEILDVTPWGQPTRTLIGEQILRGNPWTIETKSFSELVDQTWSFEYSMTTLSELAAMRGFFDAMRGSKEFFWLPSPVNDFRLTETVQSGASSITILDDGQVDAGILGTDRSLHIYINDSQAVEVSSITDNGGTLTLNLSTNTSADYPANTRVKSLHYGFFSSDRMDFRQSGDVVDQRFCTIAFQESQRNTP